MIFLDLRDNLHLWNEVLSIYFEAFPAWEREGEGSILENVQNGTYKIFLACENEEVFGFCMLDMYGTDYILLSYLAIKKDFRGRGIGSSLVRVSKEFFVLSNTKWLMIEAEYRQALLYQNLGFIALDIDYAIPAYNSKKSVKMNLMYIKKDHELNRKILKKIITNMFINGYALSKNEPRLKAQLQKIPQSIKTKEIV